MPLTVRDLPGLFLTSVGSSTTTADGHLDDATSITLFMASSASALSSAGVLVQISQFDPADKFPYGSDWMATNPGITQSSAFYNVSTSGGSAALFSTGPNSITINNISFRGLRIANFATSAGNTGDIVCYVSKQITV